MKRVVVIDDDQDVQEIVTFVLNKNSIEVISASNGEQLQQLLAAEQEPLPDLFILDVMMPGQDGYQVCRNLRSNTRTKHIPIMIITAHIESIYRRISIDLGAAHHMTKPFHPLDLLDTVQTILKLK